MPLQLVAAPDLGSLHPTPTSIPAVLGGLVELKTDESPTEYGGVISLRGTPSDWAAIRGRFSATNSRGEESIAAMRALMVGISSGSREPIGGTEDFVALYVAASGQEAVLRFSLDGYGPVPASLTAAVNAADGVFGSFGDALIGERQVQRILVSLFADGIELSEFGELQSHGGQNKRLHLRILFPSGPTFLDWNARPCDCRGPVDGSPACDDEFVALMVPKFRVLLRNEAIFRHSLRWWNEPYWCWASEVASRLVKGKSPGVHGRSLIGIRMLASCLRDIHSHFIGRGPEDWESLTHVAQTIAAEEELGLLRDRRASRIGWLFDSVIGTGGDEAYGKFLARDSRRILDLSDWHGSYQAFFHPMLHYEECYWALCHDFRSRQCILPAVAGSLDR